MTFHLPAWLLPTLLSALLLGIYDLTKKDAVRDNPILPVLFWSTLAGSGLFVALSLLFGGAAAAEAPPATLGLVALKSLLVGASWACVYYAMRELPISLASPIRASAPLWTFLGAVVCFNEIPTLIQGTGMVLVFGGYYCFSVLGRLEGFSFRHRGMQYIVLGTLLGAASALYDKYLLNVLRLPRESVQFHFALDMVLLFGGAWLIAKLCGCRFRPLTLRWTVWATGILLIAADYCYFYAVSVPDAQISILSLVRRSNCLVAFGVGAWIFRDVNVRSKAWALLLILVGVTLLALG